MSYSVHGPAFRVSSRRATPRHTTLLAIALLTALLHSTQVVASQQILRLGESAPYNFLTFASADLQQPVPAKRAIVLVHGVRRNADDYYQNGLSLLHKAGLTADDNLVLAPNFLNDADSRAGQDMPLWPRDKWMHGTESTQGRPGIAAFAVLDDLLLYLADRQRFARLSEIVLIGHSAGGQLMQRYSLLGDGDERLAGSGIQVRYVVSSPSSYLYLEDSRLQDGAFKPVRTVMCPSFSRYRYGLDRAPFYFTRQGLNAEQLFRRYAARDVTFLVGERDNKPNDRVMDRTCGASMQGPHRVQRQLNYLRYEAFLSQKWSVPIAHRQFLVADTGHNAARLFATETAANAVFTTP